jgi:UDP-N-acetyl-D-glucosamine dehydrogenase
MERLRELGGRIAARDVRIGVIGLGYVGLPLALEFARRGFRVTGFDVNRAKVESLQKGTSYIEDVPSADVADAVAKKSFNATADFGELSRCDVINVCVPTPLTRSKDPDVSHMASAMEEIRKRLRSGQLIVLGSTTYPGTTHELFVPMLESTGCASGTTSRSRSRPSGSTRRTATSRCARSRRWSAARRRCAASSRARCSRRSSTASCRCRRRRAPRW